jgi:hypothetical protein
MIVLSVKKNRTRRPNKNKKTQKKTKKNKRQTPNGVAIARRRAEFFYLSPCSSSYLKALIDPFMLEGGTACIPDLADFPSAKRLIISRGTFALGSLGVGFVLVSPYTFVNDAPSICYTTGNIFTGAGVSLSTNPGVALAAQNFPFVTADFNPTGYQGRIVGAGVRIRYLGTELNRSGRCIPVRLNRHGQPLDGATAVDFLAQPEIPSMAVTRSWKAVTFLPRTSTSSLQLVGGSLSSANDYEYSFGDSLDTGVGTHFAGADIGFFVDGGIMNNAFEYEVYGHYEFCATGGGLSPDGITPSHSDVPGLTAVRNVTESNLPVGDSSAAYSHAMAMLKAYAPQDISHVVNGGMAAAKMLGWR